MCNDLGIETLQVTNNITDKYYRLEQHKIDISLNKYWTIQHGHCPHYTE